MNRRVVLAYMIVVSSFVVIPMTAQTETFAPANDVAFTIGPEHDTYRIGEQIILKYQITNVSNGNVFVPREWSVTCPASPHIWAWFESGSGKHLIPGYAGDCSPVKQTIMERMKREAFLLKPRQRVEGHISLETKIFGEMKPGSYRIEAVLYGWDDKGFDQADQSRLQKMGAPFLRGEVPASSHVNLR